MTRTHWLLVLFAALLCAAYSAGLPGEFSLDDLENFQDLKRYLRGDIGWQGVVLGNASGPLGRPVSMASFAVTALIAGFSPLGFKLGNLALHLACGALVAVLLRAALREARLFEASAERVAVLLACWWLALPIHVSTVLYAVQRMTQLSAALTLLALLCYVWGRSRARNGDRVGDVAIWVGVPALALLSALAKENGLLALPLCAVLEWSLLGRAQRAPPRVRAFAALSILVPIAAAVVLLLLRPEQLLGGYEVRPFTLAERLLTEPRILWGYVRDILVPFGPAMGLIQDDIVVSRGWWQPPATLFAAGGWVLVAFASVTLRRAVPLFAAGAGVFLVGHALESTLIPLELHFEHRNYLPSLGVLLCVAGLVDRLAAGLGRVTWQFRVAVPVLGIAMAFAYLGATHARAGVWRSEADLVEHAARLHPSSPRLNSILAAHAMTAGDLPAALRYFERAAAGLGEGERGTIALWSVLAHCHTRTQPPAELLASLHDQPPRQLSSFGVQAVIMTSEAIYQQQCDGAAADAAIAALRPWLATLSANPGGRGSWRFRYEYGRMLASRGAYAEALALIEPAWRDSGWQVGIGVVAFQIALAKEDQVRAEAVYVQLAATVPAWDRQVREALVRFRKRLDEGLTPVSKP